MKLLIAGCGVESLLLYARGLELGLDVALPEDCKPLRSGDFDAVISMDIRIPGNRSFPPPYAMERAERWKEIAENMGIEAGDPEGKDTIFMLVARSRRGETKMYRPVILRHLDRYTYMETLTPKKEILWRLWDISTLMAQEIGFVGLAQLEFSISGRLLLTDVRLNTFDRTWILLDGSITPPDEQLLRSVTTGFLGETDSLIPVAGLQTSIAPDERDGLFSKISSIEGARIRIPDGKTLLLNIMDPLDKRRRKKIEKAIKLIHGQEPKPPAGFP